MASTSKGGNSHFMETTQLIGDLEDQMQCAICQERLKKPRVLSCLHSFCEDCLKRSHRLSVQAFTDSDSDSDLEELDFPVIKCAYCREVTELPEDGISGLKADFRANGVGEILEALEKRKRHFIESEYSCEVCTSGGESPSVPAADYCQDCGQLFCEQCSKVHRKLKNTKDHFVVGVSDLMSGRAKLRKTEHEDEAYKMCPRHSGERLQSFCRACKKPICLVCTSFGNCASHKTEVCALDEAVTEMTGIVEMLSDQVRHRQRAIDKIVSNSNRVIANTVSRKNTSIQQMIAKHQAFVRQFNIKSQKAVSNKESFFNDKVNSVQSIVADIQNMKTISNKALILADDVLKGAAVHGCDLATVYGSLQGVLRSVPLSKVDAMGQGLSKIEEDVSKNPAPHLSMALDVEATFADYQGASQVITRGQNNTIPIGSTNHNSLQMPNRSAPSSSQSTSHVNQVGGPQTPLQLPPRNIFSGPRPLSVSGLVNPGQAGQPRTGPRPSRQILPHVGYSIPPSTAQRSSSISVMSVVPPLTRELPDHRSPSNITRGPFHSLSPATMHSSNTPATGLLPSFRGNSTGSTLPSTTQTDQSLGIAHSLSASGADSAPSVQGNCPAIPPRGLSTDIQFLPSSLEEAGDFPDLGPDLLF